MFGLFEALFAGSKELLELDEYRGIRFDIPNDFDYQIVNCSKFMSFPKTIDKFSRIDRFMMLKNQLRVSRIYDTEQLDDFLNELIRSIEPVKNSFSTPGIAIVDYDCMELMVDRNDLVSLSILHRNLSILALNCNTFEKAAYQLSTDLVDLCSEALDLIVMIECIILCCLRYDYMVNPLDARDIELYDNLNDYLNSI